MPISGFPLPDIVINDSIQIAFGRELHLNDTYDDVCIIDFQELCSDKLPIMGAPDFHALCDNFSKFVVKNMPELGTVKNKNETRRFITFIDIIYDRRKDLLVSAETDLSYLVRRATDNDSALTHDKDLEIAAARMISRLSEMRFRSRH